MSPEVSLRPRSCGQLTVGLATPLDGEPSGVPRDLSAASACSSPSLRLSMGLPTWPPLREAGEAEAGLLSAPLACWPCSSALPLRLGLLETEMLPALLGCRGRTRREVVAWRWAFAFSVWPREPPCAVVAGDGGKRRRSRRVNASPNSTCIPCTHRL